MIHTIVIFFPVFFNVTLFMHKKQVEESDTLSISGIFVFPSLLASKDVGN